jgi:hypothetical protein
MPGAPTTLRRRLSLAEPEFAMAAAGRSREPPGLDVHRHSRIFRGDKDNPPRSVESDN